MKHIIKKSSNEPISLKEYRETTENATYSGFGDREQLLKVALRDEQGHLCAYCMTRIGKEIAKSNRVIVKAEHYLSQDKRPDQDLNYENMLGVCSGNIFGKAHCDVNKKEELLEILNQLKKQIESLITYNSNGNIIPIKADEKIKSDLKLLNLNTQKIVEARRGVIDLALELMKEKYPLKQWTKKLIQKEIDEWKSKNKKGQYRTFCQIAIWFLEKEKKKNRYPAK